MPTQTMELDQVADLFKVEHEEILNLVAEGQLKPASNGTFTETEIRDFITRNTYKVAS